MNVIKFIIALVAGLIIGCSSEKDFPTRPGKVNNETWPTISVSSAISVSHRIRVELLSNDSLHEGYDSLAVVLRDSVTGNILTDANVQWSPLMEMGMMQHSAPVDDYGNEASPDSLFRNGILFTMASEKKIINGGWTLRLRIYDRRFARTGDYNDSIDIPIWVKPVIPSPTIWWKSSDSLWRVAALLAPKSPVSGSNALELFIARKATALSWPADSSWTVTIVPTMPSMGHSSPNNTNPSHTGNAHYKGTVNFTMTGDWRLSFTFNRTDGNLVATDTNQFLDIKVK